MKDKTQKRVDGPTPHGGAYSIAYFFDDSGKAVEQYKATRMEILEFTEDGECIMCTYGTCGGRRSSGPGGTGKAV